MIPVYPQQLLARTAQWVSGPQPSTAFFYLIQALFNRTGGDSGVPFTSGSGLTATGSTQATALALTDDFNEVTGGVAGTGVQLANLQPGQFQLVFNGINSGNLDVWPASGGQINALGNNIHFALTNGKTQIFWCVKLQSNGAPLYRTITLG